MRDRINPGTARIVYWTWCTPPVEDKIQKSRITYFSNLKNGHPVKIVSIRVNYRNIIGILVEIVRTCLNLFWKPTSVMPSVFPRIVHWQLKVIIQLLCPINGIWQQLSLRLVVALDFSNLQGHVSDLTTNALSRTTKFNLFKGEPMYKKTCHSENSVK